MEPLDLAFSMIEAAAEVEIASTGGGWWSFASATVVVACFVSRSAGPAIAASGTALRHAGKMRDISSFDAPGYGIRPAGSGAAIMPIGSRRIETVVDNLSS